jgi:multisubunit Na+/H+ antiporter MnhB subunit
VISLLDILVAAGLLALALRTATARDDRSAVVAFVALGLLLALAWVRLASIDVALTEAAIGSGATGFLLLGAEKHLRGLAGTPALPRRSVRIVVGLFCAVIATGLSAAVLLAPDPAPTLAPQAVANMGVTGLGNAVTAVLLGYRSLDTLVEAIVLLLALLGVWSLAPIEAWGGAAQLRADDPPASLVFLARTLPPIGVMFGIYLFWEGANAPGGAFQGGTVLAAMWILLMLAGLADVPSMGSRTLHVLLLAGPAVFLAVGFAGFALAGSFLGYPENSAKILILSIEAALTLSIAVTLALLVAGPPQLARRT